MGRISEVLPAPRICHFCGQFVDRTIEQRFLAAYEPQLSRRDRNVVALIAVLELVLMTIDSLSFPPEVAWWRVSTRLIYLALLILLLVVVFPRAPKRLIDRALLLFAMAMHNPIIATYHHPQIVEALSQGFLLALYIFNITACYTFLTPPLIGIFVISLALAAQYFLMSIWVGGDPDLIYTPFVLFGLIAFSHLTAATQARQQRQIWLGTEYARQQQQRAEEGQQFRTRLLEVIGHDLHQPLGALRFYLTTIRFESATLPSAPAQRLRATTAQIQLVVRQVSDMLNKALELAQLDNDSVTTRCRRRSAVALIDVLQDLYAGEAGRYGVSLHFYGSGVSTCYDPTLMAAVLRNLIGNAIRYHLRLAPNPRVVVVFRQGGRRIDVIDNGGGLPEQMLHGNQIVSQRLAHGGGDRHGLGLLIAQQFAQKQGWQLRVINAEQRGAWFQLCYDDTTSLAVTDRGVYDD